MVSFVSDPQHLAEVLADELRAELPAATTLKVSPLSARLVRLDIASQVTGSAKITVLISISETVFEAGSGTRFELPPLPAARDAIVSRAHAVADGHLVEWVREGRTDFELALRDGEVLKGGVVEGLVRRRKRARRIEYLPFASAS